MTKKQTLEKNSPQFYFDYGGINDEKNHNGKGGRLTQALPIEFLQTYLRIIKPALKDYEQGKKGFRI